jgi:hypothetical protein
MRRMVSTFEWSSAWTERIRDESSRRGSTRERKPRPADEAACSSPAPLLFSRIREGQRLTGLHIAHHLLCCNVPTAPVQSGSTATCQPTSKTIPPTPEPTLFRLSHEPPAELARWMHSPVPLLALRVQLLERHLLLLLVWHSLLDMHIDGLHLGRVVEELVVIGAVELDARLLVRLAGRRRGGRLL